MGMMMRMRMKRRRTMRLMKTRMTTGRKKMRTRGEKHQECLFDVVDETFEKQGFVLKLKTGRRSESLQLPGE
jgi:hypothetical protein